MPTTEAQLKRRLQSGALVDWELRDPGGVDTLPTDPVSDAGVRAQLNLTLSALRDAITGVGSAAKTLGDVVAAIQATQTVQGTVGLDTATLAALETINVGNFPATQPVSIAQEVEVKNDTGSLLRSSDAFLGGEVLADQSGAGSVLTFTFTTPVQLVWVRSKGGISRADPFGGTPAASTGIPCADDEPSPITVQTSTVKVFAPSGATVSVWGYRY